MMDRRSVALIHAARADLLDRVGADRVVVATAARDAAGGGEGDEPVAVVRPADARDVSTVLRVGRARHLPVLVKSRLPSRSPDGIRGAIVLDCSSLDRPPAIDISRRVVSVGVAVPLGAIDRAARRARLSLRALPTFDAEEPVGAWVGAGEGGEIGVGAGELGADLVSATVVAGSGRVLVVGASELVGHPPWALGGQPDATGLLVGAEGRLAVLVDVTLRLWPAPWVSWAEGPVEPGRERVLATLSAGRLALQRGVAATVVLVERAGAATLAVQACTLRGEDDVAAVQAEASAIFARHGLRLADFVAEAPRARIGQAERGQPQLPVTFDEALDLRVAWPDAPKVLDVIDALAAGAMAPVPRQWALGADAVRLRLGVAGGGIERHPIGAGVRHLLDAGAVPMRASGALRDLLRERMPSTSKVLMAALSRVWDPDDVLAAGRGLL
jgi:hypothetical protein